MIGLGSDKNHIKFDKHSIIHYPGGKLTPGDVSEELLIIAIPLQAEKSQVCEEVWAMPMGIFLVYKY